MSELNGEHRAWVIVVPKDWKAKYLRGKLGHRLLSIKLSSKKGQNNG